MQFLRGDGIAQSVFLFHADGARIKPGLHAHNCNTCFRIACHDGALKGCCPAPARQKGGVEVEAAVFHAFQNGFWQQQPISDNDGGICFQGRKALGFIPQAFRVAHFEAQFFRLHLNRAFAPFKPTAAFARGLGID